MLITKMKTQQFLRLKQMGGALGSLNLSRATQPKKEELFVHGSKGLLSITRTKCSSNLYSKATSSICSRHNY